MAKRFPIIDPKTNQTITYIEADDKEQAARIFKQMRSAQSQQVDASQNQRFPVDVPRYGMTGQVDAPNKQAVIDELQRERSLGERAFGVAQQGVGGGYKGLSDLVGLPVDALAYLTNLAADLAGKPEWRTEFPLGGSKSIKKVFDLPSELAGEVPYTEKPPIGAPERYSRRIGEFSGAALPAAKAVQALSKMTKYLPNIRTTASAEALSATGAGTAEQTLMEMSGGKAKPWQRTLAAMAGSVTPFAVFNRVKNAFVNPGTLSEITGGQMSNLRKLSDDLYADVKSQNVVATRKELSQALGAVKQNLIDKNFAKQKLDKNGFAILEIDPQFPTARRMYNRLSKKLSENPNYPLKDMISDLEAIQDQAFIVGMRAAKGEGGVSGREQLILLQMRDSLEQSFKDYLPRTYEWAKDSWNTLKNLEKVSDVLQMANIKKGKLNADQYQILQNELQKLITNETKKGGVTSFSAKELETLKDVASTSNKEKVLSWLSGVDKILNPTVSTMAGGGMFYGQGMSLPEAAGTSLGLMGLGQTAKQGFKSAAVGSQEERVRKMIAEIARNPNMSEQGKQSLVKAIEAYFGPAVGSTSVAAERFGEQIMP